MPKFEPPMLTSEEEVPTEATTDDGDVGWCCRRPDPRSLVWECKRAQARGKCAPGWGWFSSKTRPDIKSMLRPDPLR